MPKSTFIFALRMAEEDPYVFGIEVAVKAKCEMMLKLVANVG